MGNQERNRSEHHRRSLHPKDTLLPQARSGSSSPIDTIDLRGVTNPDPINLNDRPSHAEHSNGQGQEASVPTALNGPIQSRRHVPVGSGPVEEPTIELDAQEVETILSVYDHLEKFIRNAYKGLPETQILEKLDAAITSEALKKYVQSKDEMDEILRKFEPGLKPWYER